MNPNLKIRRFKIIAAAALALLPSFITLSSAASDEESKYCLTNAAQVHSLSTAEARRRYPVKLIGVVLYADPWAGDLINSMMVGALGPSDLMVLIEEHPDSINDCAFAFYMPSSFSQTYWIDVPTSVHGSAGDFSFADGHCEIHGWQEPGAIKPVTYSAQIGGSANKQPKDPDIIWMSQHISTLYPP